MFLAPSLHNARDLKPPVAPYIFFVDDPVYKTITADWRSLSCTGHVRTGSKPYFNISTITVGQVRPYVVPEVVARRRGRISYVQYMGL